MASMLDLIDIQKTYEGKPLLAGVSLRVNEGEILCLLGPSGSGKSTLLRIAAGLESPDAGTTAWNGATISDLPAHRRGFGLMFQDYALFPHLDVFENVAFGLRMQRLPDGAVRREAEDALERVDLAGFARRKVAALSGGEQQRVALARALAAHPRLLMLDEPLGALDRALREELAEQLRRLLRELRIPTIYVTHDQDEAFTIAQRIALLHAGRIEQIGTPDELVEKPGSVWVSEFLGLGVALPGIIRAGRPLRVATKLGTFPAESFGTLPAAGTRGFVLLRSRDGTLRRERKNRPGGIRGTVVESIRRGGSHRIVFRAAGGEELVCLNSRPAREGEEMVWTPGKGVWLDR
jgi:spermidine/putrescine transport system ATP-binding protein